MKDRSLGYIWVFFFLSYHFIRSCYISHRAVSICRYLMFTVTVLGAGGWLHDPEGTTDEENCML